MMAEEDVGFLPVDENDRLVGTITDRDIVTRRVAKGEANGKALVRDAMAKDVKYCLEEEDMEHVMTNMGDIQLRRLPVLIRDKRLIGIVAIADAVLTYSPESASGALTGICAPGRMHAGAG